MRLFLAILCLGLLVGCDDSNRPSVPAVTNLSQPGEWVGTLPDGRRVVRYVIDPPDASRVSSYYRHTIYVVESSNGQSSSVTVNRQQPSGKTSINSTEVVINGVTYVPKTTTASSSTP